MSQQEKKKILVIEDEIEFAQILKSSLQSEGYDVSICDNGKQARYLLSFEYYDAVISDIHLPGNFNGVELLSHVRERLERNTPFILITAYAKDAYKQEAEVLKANGLLEKPFNKSLLLDILSRDVKDAPSLKLQKDFNSFVGMSEGYDHEFSKLSIDNFVSGNEIKFDVFIKIKENKYVKIAHSGDSISIDRIKSYKNKGVSYLYLKKEDFKKYLGINVELSRAVYKRNDIAKIKKLNLVKHASELVLEYTYNNDLSQDVIAGAKSIFETSFDLLADSDDGEALINILKSNGDQQYAHQLGVSFYAVMMAKAVGWRCPKTLHKLALAGLLHDIGEKDLPKEILAKSKTDLTTEERKIFETHPIRGAEILNSCPSVPTEVIQVTIQHHEDCTGTGFPYHLRKSSISPMARLIAVADAFCEIALGPRKIPAKDALNRVKNLYSNTLDKEFIKALESVFKQAKPLKSVG